MLILPKTENRLDPEWMGDTWKAECTSCGYYGPLLVLGNRGYACPNCGAKVLTQESDTR